jgi:kinesin family member 16B
MLDSMRASVQGQGNSLRVESQLPHFVVVSDDVLSTGVVIYPLREGMTLIGSDNADPKPDIPVFGCDQAMLAYVNHVVEHDDVAKRLREKVTFHPIASGYCFVDEEPVTTPVQLVQGNIVRLGEHQMFRFNHPTEAHLMRMQRQAGAQINARVFDPQRHREEQHKRETSMLAEQKAALEAENVSSLQPFHT